MPQFSEFARGAVDADNGELARELGQSSHEVESPLESLQQLAWGEFIDLLRAGNATQVVEPRVAYELTVVKEPERRSRMAPWSKTAASERQEWRRKPQDRDGLDIDSLDRYLPCLVYKGNGVVRAGSDYTTRPVEVSLGVFSYSLTHYDFRTGHSAQWPKMVETYRSKGTKGTQRDRDAIQGVVLDNVSDVKISVGHPGQSTYNMVVHHPEADDAVLAEAKLQLYDANPPIKGSVHLWRPSSSAEVERQALHNAEEYVQRVAEISELLKTTVWDGPVPMPTDDQTAAAVQAHASRYYSDADNYSTRDRTRFYWPPDPEKPREQYDQFTFFMSPPKRDIDRDAWLGQTPKR